MHTVSVERMEPFPSLLEVAVHPMETAGHTRVHESLPRYVTLHLDLQHWTTLIYLMYRILFTAPTQTTPDPEHPTIGRVGGFESGV